MNVILPEDLAIFTNESEGFQYCPKPLIAGNLLPLTINEAQGNVHIKEYCLTYPPEWGRIIDCAQVGKTPFKYVIEANSEIHISIMVPGIDGEIGVFGLNISDNELKWDMRFKVTSAPDQLTLKNSLSSSKDIILTNPAKKLYRNG